MRLLTAEGKAALLVGLQLCRMHQVPLPAYFRLFHFISQEPAPNALAVADEVDIIRATPAIGAIAPQPLNLLLEPDSLMDLALQEELEQAGILLPASKGTSTS